MYADMTACDLAEWEADYNIEPWGDDLNNYLAAGIRSTIAAAGGVDMPINEAMMKFSHGEKDEFDWRATRDRFNQYIEK